MVMQSDNGAEFISPVIPVEGWKCRHCAGSASLTSAVAACVRDACNSVGWLFLRCEAKFDVQHGRMHYEAARRQAGLMTLTDFRRQDERALQLAVFRRALGRQSGAGGHRRTAQ